MPPFETVRDQLAPGLPRLTMILRDQGGRTIRAARIAVEVVKRVIGGMAVQVHVSDVVGMFEALFLSPSGRIVRFADPVVVRWTGVVSVHGQDPTVRTNVERRGVVVVAL